MTPAERKRLRDLAGKATPGPWEYGECAVDGAEFEAGRRYGRVFFRGHPNPNTNTRDCKLYCRDAEFIAAANPAAVIALLDENERLRDALKKFGTHLAHGPMPTADDCKTFDGGPCTCGLDAALKGDE